MTIPNRFPKPYTNAQRAAIARAIRDGRPCRDIPEMAARGQLGVPAFKVLRHHVYEIWRQERVRVESAYDGVISDLLAMAARRGAGSVDQRGFVDQARDHLSPWDVFPAETFKAHDRALKLEAVNWAAKNLAQAVEIAIRNERVSDYVAEALAAYTAIVKLLL